MDVSSFCCAAAAAAAGAAALGLWLVSVGGVQITRDQSNQIAGVASNLTLPSFLPSCGAWGVGGGHGVST